MPESSTRRDRDAGAARAAPLRVSAAEVHRLVFDQSGTVERPSLPLLWRELMHFILDPPPAPPTPAAPRGDGHPVLVFPPFLCGDGSTRLLRRYLEDCGYATYGWELGRNLGPSDAVLEGTARLVAETSARHGRRISVIGVSLGGIFAREAAKRHAACVRQVITLCSPFRLPTASTVAPLFRLCTARYSLAASLTQRQEFAHLLPALAEPPPVPTAAIYTRRDGIVAWRSCLNPEAPEVENLEVSGAHVTIARNPQALAILAERLARPETPAQPPADALEVAGKT